MRALNLIFLLVQRYSLLFPSTAERIYSTETVFCSLKSRSCEILGVSSTRLSALNIQINKGRGMSKEKLNICVGRAGRR